MSVEAYPTFTPYSLDQRALHSEDRNTAVELQFVASVLAGVWPLTDWHATGSRLFGSATNASDWDWVGLNVARLHGTLLAKGFTFNSGSMRRAEVKDPPRFRTYRRAHINLIVAIDQEFLDAYLAATEECLELGPQLTKAERVKVFRNHLYGEPCDRSQLSK